MKCKKYISSKLYYVRNFRLNFFFFCSPDFINRRFDVCCHSYYLLLTLGYLLFVKMAKCLGICIRVKLIPLQLFFFANLQCYHAPVPTISYKGVLWTPSLPHLKDFVHIWSVVHVHESFHFRQGRGSGLSCQFAFTLLYPKTFGVSVI